MSLTLNPTTGEFDVINKKASKVKIVDPGGHFTGTEVETALQEVGKETTYADSPGIMTGGEISEGTNAGTFKVAALTAYLRSTNSLTAPLVYVTLAEQDNQPITAPNTTYFICLDYNDGNPQIVLSTSNPYGRTTSPDRTQIPIGKVMEDGSNVHFISGGFNLQDGIMKLHQRAGTLRSKELSSGSTIAYSGTNNFTMSAGIVYVGINRVTLDSYDSATTQFTPVYQDGSGGWTEGAKRNTIDYAHYDDGDGTLGNVGVSKYSCHWVYKHVDDNDVYVVYGRGSYKLAEAELQGEPSKPDQLTDFGCLIGKIIAPQSGGSFAVIQMVTDTFFVGTSVSDHGHLGGLDDDDHPQYHNDARALTWINTQSVNEMSDVATTGEAKNDVLMFNGTNYVPVPEGTTFTFSCTSFSDGEGTTQLIGTGDWKAAEAINFTATYDNGPPTTADIQKSINGASYATINTMDGPAYTSGNNTDAVAYPASKDQYLRFRLSSSDGVDSDTDYDSAIYFRNYIRWGALSKASGFTEADVESLSDNAISNDQTRSENINAGAGEYLVFAYPSSYTSIHATGFKFNSIACPFEAYETVSITNSAGYTENYKVYASSNANLGNHTLVTSTSSNLINPLYYGVTTKTDTFTEADVEGLANSEITNDNTQEWDSVTAGSGEYLLFAFPTRLGTVTFWVGGFEGGFESPETVSVTNSNGYTEDYYVWRSTNSNLGATVVTTA